MVKRWAVVIRLSEMWLTMTGEIPVTDDQKMNMMLWDIFMSILFISFLQKQKRMVHFIHLMKYHG